MKKILTSEAPTPVGPYSQAVVHGNLVFASGQIPLDPKTGERIDGDVEAQTERVIENLHAVLTAAGSSLERVVRTTVYVTDLTLFGRINAVYARFFVGDPAPARATVQVAALPLGAQIEIDAIAALD
ncbi:MAG: RidA family protein [Myxococcales bacterium]|nr:RidA family protein [Myxococcales bacterium]MDH5305689.1 RidA family protein [Myxococcales bacterium]MDH5566155.1 RidA family protein [Myxococcales bacterium]